MTDNDRKPLMHLVPAILTGSAALIAALTTVYINVRSDRQADKPATAVTPARMQPMVTSMPDTLRLQIDRIIVHDDGSPGTTDWRFAVEVDDRPLLVFAQEALSDQQGRNVVAPDDATGVFQQRTQGPIKLKVRGWRGSRLRLSEGEPDVAGEVSVLPGGVLAPMVVQGDRDDAGSFEFHVSISAQ